MSNVQPTFEEFVEKSDEECRICAYFRRNPKVRIDIESVLDSGKVKRRCLLVQRYLDEHCGVEVTALQVGKHFQRHRNKGDR